MLLFGALCLLAARGRQLIGLRRAVRRTEPVTEAVGYGDLAVEDLVRLKRHDVEPDFIRRLQAAGFEERTVDKIIRLKRADG